MGSDAAPAIDTREERVLGAARRLRAGDVAALAEVSAHSARRFWRALGLPEVAHDQVAFTEMDVEALRHVSAMVRDGVIDDTTALALARAIGRSCDRMASWQVQLIGESLAEAEHGSVADAVERVADLAPTLAERLEPLVTYAWRRHLASATRRFVTETAPDASVPTLTRSVCFADLVSFTRLVRRLPERELSGVVQRFETITSDLITEGGGRVIKTVGDEVLFVAWPPPVAVEIALQIADRISVDPMLPDVRIGVATGDVLARLGDVFGTTVNLASRMTAIAQPSHVVCDEATARAMAEIESVSCTPLRRRAVKGLGNVTPWLITRRLPNSRPKWKLNWWGWGIEPGPPLEDDAEVEADQDGGEVTFLPASATRSAGVNSIGADGVDAIDTLGVDGIAAGHRSLRFGGGEDERTVGPEPEEHAEHQSDTIG